MLLRNIHICIGQKCSSDETSIYRLYYFAQGVKIDQGKFEVVYMNDYYSAAKKSFTQSINDLWVNIDQIFPIYDIDLKKVQL